MIKPRTSFFDTGLCEVFVESSSPVTRWTIERSDDGFNAHLGRLNLQISLTRHSITVAKAVVLLVVVHVILNLVFGAFSVRNLLTINTTELGVWAMLTYYLVGVSVKSLAIWLVSFFAVDLLFTVYGYGSWLSAEPPELLLWVLTAKRFTA
jgi:hypothetical protein